MNDLEAHELQALIRYHCQSVVDGIDNGGIKPSQILSLEATGVRINRLIDELKTRPEATKR